MKKVYVILALALCLILPLCALAEEARVPAGCGVEGHYKGDGLDHARAEICWLKGHYACDGEHDYAACGYRTHYTCDGRDHSPNPCGAEGHTVCDWMKHGPAACGLEGHCISDELNHRKAYCGVAGHYLCDGLIHHAADCGKDGHGQCDGLDHSRAACGKYGHYACDGLTHSAAACGNGSHCAGDGLDHGAASCGTAGHTLCDGRKHEPGACGVEGHYACDARAHLNRTISIYCSAVPQHMVCQGNEMHDCDPENGGCGDTYACSRSNAHTACRMCGLLWCDTSLGGHETPCKDAAHRPCVYTMNGETYIRDKHLECYWCGASKCNGEAHGEGLCVHLCRGCGQGKRYNESHRMECGHYGCVRSRIRHELCPVCHRGYTCDPHHVHHGGQHHDKDHDKDYGEDHH